MRLDLATISSKLLTSRVTTACAPHNNPMRRAVWRSGVSTNNGTEGRSRAIRRAVDPDLVKQTIADVGTVRAMLKLAAASASAVVASGTVSVKWIRSA